MRPQCTESHRATRLIQSPVNYIVLGAELETDVKVDTMLDTRLPPEMSSGKLVCSDCRQGFTSIWVLKAHKEEEHGQLLPQSYVDTRHCTILIMTVLVGCGLTCSFSCLGDWNSILIIFYTLLMFALWKLNVFVPYLSVVFLG